MQFFIVLIAKQGGLHISDVDIYKASDMSLESQPVVMPWSYTYLCYGLIDSDSCLQRTNRLVFEWICLLPLGSVECIFSQLFRRCGTNLVGSRVVIADSFYPRCYTYLSTDCTVLYKFQALTYKNSGFFQNVGVIVFLQ